MHGLASPLLKFGYHAELLNSLVRCQDHSKARPINLRGKPLHLTIAKFDLSFLCDFHEVTDRVDYLQLVFRLVTAPIAFKKSIEQDVVACCIYFLGCVLQDIIRISIIEVSFFDAF